MGEILFQPSEHRERRPILPSSHRPSEHRNSARSCRSDWVCFILKPLRVQRIEVALYPRFGCGGAFLSCRNPIMRHFPASSQIPTSHQYRSQIPTHHHRSVLLHTPRPSGSPHFLGHFIHRILLATFILSSQISDPGGVFTPILARPAIFLLAAFPHVHFVLFLLPWRRFQGSIDSACRSRNIWGSIFHAHLAHPRDRRAPDLPA
ncbi:hypothetical protein B0H10DRAFT_1338148 [Mycena sp. CBHHK59/15]|nr:hypothetical protein B0H10DRAFT_1338148 [Mycena sp. CBHHK59/15]